VKEWGNLTSWNKCTTTTLATPNFNIATTICCLYVANMLLMMWMFVVPWKRCQSNVKKHLCTKLLHGF
jgi:hypothetical protein